MLSKSFEPVKSLRPRFSTKILSDQKAAVKCDTRWSHRPLYEFVFSVPLPAAERLVLLSLASYRDIGSNKHVHFGTKHPNAYDIQQDTGLPRDVVVNILTSLYDAGYIEIDGLWLSTRDNREAETYFVQHSLPKFFEYFSLSRALEGALEDAQRSEISAQLEQVSSELRQSFAQDSRPVDRIQHLYPGLYRSHVQPWIELEIERARDTKFHHEKTSNQPEA